MRRTLPTTLLLAAAATGIVFSYTRPRFDIGGEIKQSRWPVTSPVAVSVNIDPPNSIVSGSQPLEAVRNFFEIRSAYSSITFAPTQTSAPESVGFDGTSLVTFKNTPANVSATFGFGAVTFFWFNVVDGEPVVIESDIAFNPLLGHTTTGSGGFDIENLGGHEMTHFLSLEHSGVLGSTGYPNFGTADTTKRSLALDDIAGSEFLYPLSDTTARTGALSGTVLEDGSSAVFGAQVVAVGQTDGVVVSELSVDGGAWRIDALPPGDYTVYCEPFDGPYEETLIDDGIYSAPFDTSFLTRFAGGGSPTVFSLTAGSEIGGIVLDPSSAAPALNPRRLGLSPNSTTPVADTVAVAVTQGSSAFLTVSGPGIDSVPDDGLSVSGPGVTVSSAGVTRGTIGGDPYMIVSVTVDPNAPPVVRSIFADDGTNIAAITGGFEALRSTALPGLLRNDEITGIGPPSVPALGSVFPLDAVGPDAFAGIGEGTLRESAGTDDDDDLYVPDVPSGYLDADPTVAADPTRPLVFYQLTDPTADLRLHLTPAGRIEITY